MKPQKSDLAKPQRENPLPFFVGTYTELESQGIYKYLLHDNGSLTLAGLASTSEDPSFLAFSQDKQFLLAANEIDSFTGGGSIESFRVNGDQLELINRKPSGGKHPCFVTVNSDGFVLAANYSSGSVGLLRLNSEGELSDVLDIQQHAGSGSTERQDTPHAHSVWFQPSTNIIITADLGTNDLWFSKLDPEQQKLLPLEPQTISLDAGAGPRHLAFHPDNKWFYVANELNSTVTVINQPGQDQYEKGASFSSLPEGYTEPNTCSDIHLSRNGKFLYVANRGHNSIAVFRVSFMDGSLTLLGHKSSGGEGPRAFAFSPDEKYLLVANQHTNNIVTLKCDIKTGLLKYKDQTAALTPSSIVF